VIVVDRGAQCDRCIGDLSRIQLLSLSIQVNTQEEKNTARPSLVTNGPMVYWV
jgi:hypothetical protein